eukprot:3475891-Prymnesium_polylepis.1
MDGATLAMESLKGKPVVMTFGDKVELLLYPSDEFGGQELPADKVGAFVTAQSLPVNAPGCHLMAKVNTNGTNTDPVWQFAKSQHAGDVKWNFEGMFLFDKDGKCVERFDGRRAMPDDAKLRAML